MNPVEGFDFRLTSSVSPSLRRTTPPLSASVIALVAAKALCGRHTTAAKASKKIDRTETVGRIGRAVSITTSCCAVQSGLASLFPRTPKHIPFPRALQTNFRDLPPMQNGPAHASRAVPTKATTSKEAVSASPSPTQSSLRLRRSRAGLQCKPLRYRRLGPTPCARGQVVPGREARRSPQASKRRMPE